MVKTDRREYAYWNCSFLWITLFYVWLCICHCYSRKENPVKKALGHSTGGQPGANARQTWARIASARSQLALATILAAFVFALLTEARLCWLLLSQLLQLVSSAHVCVGGSPVSMQVKSVFELGPSLRCYLSKKLTSWFYCLDVNCILRYL
mgnify:CR=1 FL=1